MEIDIDKRKGQLRAAMSRYRIKLKAGLVGSELQKKRLAAPILSEAEAIKTWVDRVEYRDGKLYWVKPYHPSKKGLVVGSKCGGDYAQVRIAGYGNVQLYRFIFFLFRGYLPKFVDHKDGDSWNNRIENLREATHAQNIQNAKTPCTNTSGRKGVCWNKKERRWVATIGFNGQRKSLGMFANFEDAVKARESAEEKYHGEYRRG